ncbi:zinc-dependent metalloprotease [Chitinophaga niabensis]|uniref:DUF5117 and DUF5118 domain-containing protein n=1 Tax=Chitinophaga niabensis TaxID=536979 RepID=UPI0031BA9A8C
MYRRILTIAACIAVLTTSAQDVPKGPMPFDKFQTKDVKTIDGDFPIYQRGKNYYMEIPGRSLDKDILVMGYVRRGNASAISKSSGIVRFSKGINDHLDVTRPMFSEGASGDVNGDMEPVIKKSGRVPVNYGYRIEALGREKNSYIIDITRQITETGDWFGFNDLSFLNHPDPQRSYVQSISPENKGVRFIVERSQTDYMGSTGGPKKPNNSSYEIELLFSELSGEKMPRKIAQENSGFETFSFTDYGKVAYTARKTEFIRKWDIRPGKQRKGLASPVKPITVVIDPLTPDFYRSYIKAGILAWNKAFHAAGYRDVLEVSVDGDLQLAPGKIIVNWGNAYTNVLNATVDNPETGEIMMARINLTAAVTDDLMLKYLVQCGAADNRIIKDFKHREIAGSIIQWQITRAMGKVLGLKENLAASTHYTPAQLRDITSLKNNGISASVMDDLGFNYLVQPGDQVPAELLLPRIGADDIAAIRWAYGTEPKPGYTWLPEGNTDPFTRHGDLSSDITEASILGIKNLERLYPQLKTVSAQLDGTIDLFNVNGSLYGALQREYYKYVTDVLSQIGGAADRKTGRVTVPVSQQRKALGFLSTYVFNGVPAWMNERLSPSGKVLDVEDWMVRLQETALTRLTSPEVLGALAQQDGLDAAEVFAFIDKTVFKSFNKNTALTPAERAIQLNFIYNLSQAAFKANISNGLSDGNVLLHYYLTSTAQKLAQLGEEHTDLLSRENYRLMKMKVDKEFFSKIKV